MAYATHFLLDWLSGDTRAPYGIEALWPFTHEWYISGLDPFRQTTRFGAMEMAGLRMNLAALTQEVAILLPIVI